MVKPLRIAGKKEVVYTDHQWQLFRDFRERASEPMRGLEKLGIRSIVHGSIARGDVKEGSDVDVVILQVIPSYKVELALCGAGVQLSKREIVMATPWQLPKAHVYVEEDHRVTFPLLEPRRLETEFYYFSGAVGLEKIAREERVPGVDKRLMLIEPTKRGHVERQVIGREAEIAKRLGVSFDIVHERVTVLTRRAKIGRTGIFLQRSLAPGESFEAVFRQIVASNPAVKLRLKKARIT
ncbi:MAG: nucleotidyltransferase domain-containing protein [Candidatus Hadarchaeota archaeon]|nr:nucleotidyltransferase domain-containing protein [Candidatus Hadarchaeota archaeon]